MVRGKQVYECCSLNVCVSPKLICWNITHLWLDFERWLDHECGAFLNGICGLIISLTPSAMWGHSKKEPLRTRKQSRIQTTAPWSYTSRLQNCIIWISVVCGLPSLGCFVITAWMDYDIELLKRQAWKNLVSHCMWFGVKKREEVCWFLYLWLRWFSGCLLWLLNPVLENEKF
jgi:hypothetical protein